jgi:Tfp pilus assembly protein PilX
MHRQEQRGMTLVVSLIMLAVLTLIVVSAIRFGNINQRIAGNAQTEAEAAAAAQVAVETMLKTVDDATKIDNVAAVPAMQVSTGGQTYTVNAAKPACTLSKNLTSLDLDTKNKPEDRKCIDGDPPKIYDADGNLIPGLTACKDQQWDISASVADASSGASVSILQGVAVRVSSEVQCP